MLHKDVVSDEEEIEEQHKYHENSRPIHDWHYEDNLEIIMKILGCHSDEGPQVIKRSNGDGDNLKGVKRSIGFDARLVELLGIFFVPN